jgi:hypothetical protein
MKQINYNVPLPATTALNADHPEGRRQAEGWIFADTVDGNKKEFKDFIKKYRAKYNTIPRTTRRARHRRDYGLAKALEKSKAREVRPGRRMRSGITVNGAT